MVVVVAVVVLHLPTDESAALDSDGTMQVIIIPWQPEEWLMEMRSRSSFFYLPTLESQEICWNSAGTQPISHNIGPWGIDVGAGSVGRQAGRRESIRPSYHRGGEKERQGEGVDRWCVVAVWHPSQPGRLTINARGGGGGEVGWGVTSTGDFLAATPWAPSELWEGWGGRSTLLPPQPQVSGPESKVQWGGQGEIHSGGGNNLPPRMLAAAWVC